MSDVAEKTPTAEEIIAGEDPDRRANLILALGDMNWVAILSCCNGEMTAEGRKDFKISMQNARKRPSSDIMNAMLSYKYLGVFYSA